MGHRWRVLAVHSATACDDHEGVRGQHTWLWEEALGQEDLDVKDALQEAL